MDMISKNLSETAMSGKIDSRQSFSYLALFLLLYVALPSFILSAFMLFRVGSPRSAYWISMAVLSGAIFYNRSKLGIADYVVFFGVLLACHAFAYYFLDFSFDRLEYHQPAVRRIVNGFNPVYDGYMNLGRPPDSWSDQATYFPKATWYFAVAVTTVWGDLQLGKVYNILLLFAALFFMTGATKKEHVSIRALWIIACLNPIALTQSTGYLVDGTLSSLTTIAIFYAHRFFSEKPISRFQHFFCIVSVSMLFCVKTTGFAYGSIVIFFITLHRLFKGYRESTFTAFAGRASRGVRAMLSLGLKLGIPVFVLVSVWGFAPYATNVLNGRHIFYPLVRENSTGEGLINLESIANQIYPNAHNRFTRLLYSIAAHPMSAVRRGELKSPLNISLSEWEPFAYGRNMRTAGLGPLFFLLCLISVPAVLAFRFRGNGWLLFMLLILLFIQPYAWQMRYAPFLWLFPLACLMSVPEKRRIYLWAPFSIAIINAAGILYFSVDYELLILNQIRQFCSPHAEETVMLPQTIFEYDSIFKRFGIRQKYVNPEETFFHRPNCGLGHLPTLRTSGGVNIFFEEDLMPLPETSLVFSEEAARPWLRMSEGLVPVEALAQDFTKKTEWRTYADMVKFYMSLDKEPKEDWELSLKGSVFDARWDTDRKLEVLVFINNRQIGVWQIDKNSSTGTFIIPQTLMGESFEDEIRLVTLMLRLQGVPSLAENNDEVSAYGLQLEEMQISPYAESAPK